MSAIEDAGRSYLRILTALAEAGGKSKDWSAMVLARLASSDDGPFMVYTADEIAEYENVIVGAGDLLDWLEHSGWIPGHAREHEPRDYTDLETMVVTVKCRSCRELWPCPYTRLATRLGRPVGVQS